MSADSLDEFPYRLDERNTSEKERQRYWAVAIGLQKVDGLEVSPYLEGLSHSHIGGKQTLEQTGILLREHYGLSATSAQGPTAAPDGIDAHTCEADLVSYRIAELLETGSFFLAPAMLQHIHAKLFQDLDPEAYRPGTFKSERLVKQEEILNGDSVLYADPSMIDLSLSYLFREESAHGRGIELSGADLEDFCRFIAHIWQVHPFVEGNTRTIAVFSELYLNSLGLGVDNDPFAEHARYYRDALVRANYRNPAGKIMPNLAYLVRFYDNLINDAGHELKRGELLCPTLFDNPSLLKNIDPAEALSKRA